MPAVPVVRAVAYGESALPAQEDEGIFYDRNEDLDEFADGILLVSPSHLRHTAVRHR